MGTMVVLQHPMELAAGAYAQPERDAIPVGNAKVAVVFMEIYFNPAGTGSATIDIQTATTTDPTPYSQVTAGGFVTPTGAQFTLPPNTIGTAIPITVSALGDLIRFNVISNTLSNPIRFSITVYLHEA